MNILIVDDSNPKYDLMAKLLVECGVPRENIHHADCAKAAREAVNARPHELLLIDLILPANKGEARKDVGFELLQECVEDGCAARIIGTTANAEALAEYADRIQEMTEQLLLVDEVNLAWRDSLRNVVQQIKAREERPVNYGLDFCILTAVRNTEYTALLDLPFDFGAEKVLPNGSLYREATFDAGGRRRRGLVAHAKQMGMVAACHLTQSIINEFRPKIVLMTGICGGLPGETKLGDLVIADKSWDWQSGKYAADGKFKAAPDPKDASPKLVAEAKALEAGVNEVLKVLIDKSLRSPGTKPVFVDGPMLTGSSVVASKEIHELFVAQHRKPVAVDMETYGVYYACHMAGAPAPEFVCMKAVSDQTDANKGDEYQPYCSHLSAQVAWRLLSKLYA